MLSEMIHECILAFWNEECKENTYVDMILFWSRIAIRHWNSSSFVKTTYMPKILRIHDSGNNPPLRVTHRKKRRSKGARTLVRCGCCKQLLEIYPSEDPNSDMTSGQMVEINGVGASIQQWRQIFCPILGLGDGKPKKFPEWVKSKKTGDLRLVLVVR